MMSLSKSFVPVALLACIVIPTSLAETTVDFTAIELAGQWGTDWNWGLTEGPFDKKPESTEEINVTSGAEMFWELAYDGLGSLVYGWGAAPGVFMDSISINLGPEDFDYLTIATLKLGNDQQSATVADLVLQTDLGVLKGGEISSSGPDDSYTFGYDELVAFSTFTLTGATTFQWTNSNYNANHLAVMITGGNSSPVVSEPKSLLLFLVGLAALGARAARRRSQLVRAITLLA